MSNSTIEWTDKVWNPVTGCTKVSAGCKHCYAERIFHRPYPGRPFTDVQCHPDRLPAPLHWRKPCRVFVNSMSDLFHDAVPRDFIDAVWSTMAEAKQHTFQILTKRPARMLEFMLDRQRKGWKANWNNIWLGVSVEDQETADERIPLLLKTPAAVRFISAEPLLGPIDIAKWLEFVVDPPACLDSINPIHWVIVGGESGPNARPMHPDWACWIRDQCLGAQVPYFFKQWGEWLPVELDDDGGDVYACPADGSNDTRLEGMSPRPLQKLDHQYMSRVGKKTAGRLLDGRTWEEFPA